MARHFAPEDQALGKHVSAEHDSTRDAVEAEGEVTRSELREIRAHLLQQGKKQSVKPRGEGEACCEADRGLLQARGDWRRHAARRQEASLENPCG